MNGYSMLQGDAPAAPAPLMPSSMVTPGSSAASLADANNMQQQHLAYQQQQMQQQIQHQQMQVQQVQQAHQAFQQQAHQALQQQAHQALQQQAQQAFQQQAQQAQQGQQTLQAQQAHLMLPPAMHLPSQVSSVNSGIEQPPTQLPPAINGAPLGADGQSDSNSSIPHHPIAEFLYQLTKMLSDNNEEIVEWTNGRIKVHFPDRLEGEVLHKYFRHSKFASFQRQLNYFGFRKIAGKGKMSPCSYVNDGATTDIRSLLNIKRKTNGSAARKAAMAQAQQQRMIQKPVQTAVMLPQSNMMMSSAPAATMTVDLFKNAFAAAGMSAQQMQTLQGMALAATPGGMFMPSNVTYAQVAAMQAQQQQNTLAQQAANMQHRQMSDSLFFPNDNAALAAIAQGGRNHSIESMASLAPGAMPSTGSLDAMASFGSLGAFAQRQSALNLAALFGSPLSYGAQYTPQPTPSSGAATTVLSGLVPNTAPLSAAGAASATLDAASAQPPNPTQGAASAALAASMPSEAGAATAALAAAMPTGVANGALVADGPASASAAMRAATSHANSMFDNNANLNALLGKEEEKTTTPGPAPGSNLNRFSSNNLLRLPSSGAFFPDNFSSVSLSGLLPGMSSNRLNSMLSLSSFLSRDPSMVDFTGAGSNYGNPPFSNLSAAPPLSALTSGAPLSAASLAALRAAASYPIGLPSGYPIPALATAGTPGVGFEPTPIQDMNANR